jgi:hypothetical protein
VEEWDPGQPLPEGPFLFYISENRYLLRSLTYPDGLFPFLGERPPDRRVGTSIRVYSLNGAALLPQGAP